MTGVLCDIGNHCRHCTRQKPGAEGGGAIFSLSGRCRFLATTFARVAIGVPFGKRPTGPEKCHTAQSGALPKPWTAKDVKMRQNDGEW